MKRDPTLAPHGILFNESARILLMANTLVLIAAVYFGWSVFEIMFAYWLETFIIAFFSIVKMLHHSKLKALPLIGLFTICFGLFTAGHIFIINRLFGAEVFGDEFGLFAIAGEIVAQSSELWPVILILFISHVYSLYKNYFGHYQYLTRSLGFFFLYTYPRLFTTHFVLLLAGYFIVDLPIYVGLISLFLLKTLVDAYTHHIIHISSTEDKIHSARQQMYDKMFGQKT